VVLGAGAASVVAAAGPAWSAPPSAFTLPGLKQWRPGAGALRLGRRVDVVVPRGSGEALEQVALRLVGDLRARGRSSSLRVGGPRRGGIALRLHHGEGPQEGYRLTVADHVQVHARTATGAYWGTRTVLQWLDRNDGRLPRGHGLDWPSFGERALMVDVGRKYFPMGWLKARIREMSDLKLNLLHLHFTDDQGWRFESTASPRIHSDEFISRRQVQALVEYAAARHVTVMPEIDLPGHMLTGLRNYPHLQLADPLGQRAANKLDYTLPAAKTFVLDRFREYLDLFPGPEWHLGGDEYLNPVQAAAYPQLAAYARDRAGPTAATQDGAVAFLHDLNTFLRARGKRCRMWNDGLAGTRIVTLDRSISVDWWTDISPLGDPSDVVSPLDLVADGYRVTNCSYYPTYLAYLSTRQPLPGLKPFYEGWTPARFRGATYATDEVATPYYETAPSRVAGAKMHVWLDEPDSATAAEVARDLAPRLAITAERAWNLTSRVTDYDDFRDAQQG
jgi:hexosaminidase